MFLSKHTLVKWMYSSICLAHFTKAFATPVGREWREIGRFSSSSPLFRVCDYLIDIWLSMWPLSLHSGDVWGVWMHGTRGSTPPPTVPCCTAHGGRRYKVLEHAEGREKWEQSDTGTLNQSSSQIPSISCPSRWKADSGHSPAAMLAKRHPRCY